MAQSHTVAVEDIANRVDEVVTELREGHTLKLIQGGKKIAEIVPCEPEPTREQREAARQRLLALLKEGIPLGGVPPTRDEMHER